MKLFHLSTLLPLLAIGAVSGDTPAFDESRNGLMSQSYTGNPDCQDFGYSFGWKNEGCHPTSGDTFPYDGFESLTGGADIACVVNGVGDVEIACAPEEEEEVPGMIGRTSGRVGGRKLNKNKNNNKKRGRKLEEEYVYATITSTVDVVVIMKGGNGGTIYDGLQAGTEYTLDIGEDLKEISHMEFCFSCPDTPEPTEAPTAPPTPTPEPETRSFDPVDTCLDESENGSNLGRSEYDGMACYNMTSENFFIPEEGSVCLSMSTGGALNFDFHSFEIERGNGRGMYGTKIWVGTDPADIPRKEDGTVDTASFPYGDIDVGDVISYSTSVEVDSAEACSGETSYPLYIAVHTTFGDRCVPLTGHSTTVSGNAETDESTWAQDQDNQMFSDDRTFTYFSVEISCDCVPPTTRTVDEPEPEKTPPPIPDPTPGPATSSGDPHFKTWSGEKFDYHGECDLVLVDNPSFSDGLGLQIHIRTTRIQHWSFIEQIAVKVGNDVLEFDNDLQNFLINGAKVEAKRKHHETMLGGFVVRRDAKALSIRLNGGYKDRDAIAKIDLHGRRNGFPAVVVDGGKTDVFKGSLGLLGDWKTGRKLARDGVTEIADATAFALEWQVRDTESKLFKDARFPQYPKKCTPPAAMALSRLGSDMRKEAEKACAHWKKDKEDCIFDVIATRDVLVAEEGHIVHLE